MPKATHIVASTELKRTNSGSRAAAGHSRLREFVFGGVTRGILREGHSRSRADGDCFTHIRCVIA